MSYATNAIDGTRVYFEDDGGEGAPVGFYGGFFDSIPTVRELPIAAGLRRDGFRTIFIDHRGLGLSDKPHEPSAYRMDLRAADAVAVLDALHLDRAHFVGASWGGRLCFGIGQHAPDRSRSLVVGGQQPYEWLETPMTRVFTEALQANGTEGAVGALERYWGRRMPESDRTRYLQQDHLALQAAWATAISEGPVSRDLRAWRTPCFIFMGAGDADFIEQAREAAEEIPTARIRVLEATDHYGAHVDDSTALVDEIVGWLRETDRSVAPSPAR